MDLFISAVLWITKTGAPWLDLPGLFGKRRGPATLQTEGPRVHIELIC